jgi:hypothetical protein
MTNVSLRIGTLQTASPQSLKLLGYVSGKPKLEKAFHDHYQNYKTDQGGKEWFRNPPLRFED